MALAFAKKLAVGVAATYLSLTGILYATQRQLMYFPTNENPEPAQVGLADVSVEKLETPDGESLTAWYAPADIGQPTILFFHGNAGEISDRAARFSAYRAAGLGVLFVSWRGYGGSTGSPSENGIIIDSRTAYDWLVLHGVKPDAIAVSGESLGTGAAVRLAAETVVGALILGAPYSSTAEVAKRQYPFLPVELLMKDQFRSIDHVAAVKAPVLIIHGTADRVVPFALGLKLFNAVTAPKEFIALEHGDHAAISGSEALQHEVEFIRRTIVPTDTL